MKKGIVAEYQTSLQRHLATYKASRLGVHEAGVFDRNGRSYQHILPLRLRQLNILELFRAEFWAYLEDHPEIRLHKYFHHLNSSQALAFNLFFPFLSAGPEGATAIMRALGVPGSVARWKFEHVPDATEGTNVDVAWCSTDRSWVFCEVKLSEAEFGGAKTDNRHRKKYAAIYAKRLSRLVEPSLLEFEEFCRHYQLLRNISFLSHASVGHIVFLLPSANEALAAPLARVLDGLAPSARERVRVAYLERVLALLRSDTGLTPGLSLCASALSEKYVPA